MGRVLIRPIAFFLLLFLFLYVAGLLFSVSIKMWVGGQLSCCVSVSLLNALLSLFR